LVQCRSAVLVQLTALHGATLYRVERNDAYIAHMLRLLDIFYRTFCVTKQPPEENFFGSQLGYHYHAFLETTLQIARRSVVIAHVKQSEVQRSDVNTDLFL